MNTLFNNLLVSCPNGGGLFFIYEGKEFRLDGFNTTGLSVNGRKILRGVQPSAVYLYDAELCEIGQDAAVDDIHDVYIGDNCYYLIGTFGNEIIKLDGFGNELQRWVFTGEKDSLHINCIETWNGRVVFSAFGDFSEHRGYKGKTEKCGFVQDLLTGQRLITGLSQPHSLVSIGQNLLLANSEHKEISEFAPSGDLIRTLKFDGYTRGICVSDKTIYIGLSCSRNIEPDAIGTATIVAIDRISLVELGRINLPAKEIYSIQALANPDDAIYVLANITSTSSSRLIETAAEREGQIVGLNQAVTERDGQIASLTEEAVRRGEWALRLESELKDAQSSLLAVTQSNSWKLMLPLREARRWLGSPARQSRRYARAVLKLAKRTYQSLPLSPQTKAKHRNALARYLPRMLLASGAHPATVPVFVIPTPLLTEARVEDIQLVISETPVVSVIIPVYGELAYTLRCLRSISVNAPSADFEIIVVDDCSPDNSADVLKTIPGVRLLQNTENLGFIRSCNAGANASRGEYLLFLNNDTEVHTNWMDELLRTFYEFPGTGLAGSKLVYPDGRLQEAGGIIWQDGSAWNFGRFHDPNLPVYNYAREVDYCSGASIMVPKTLFDELGGFDEYYLPAYCEDADLALKIRGQGYRVIYQPMSTVIHYEGITSGTDTSQGTKAYQVENTKKLYGRWKDPLQTHQVSGMDIDAAKDRRASRRVLVIDHCTPTPDEDSGSIDAYNIMLLLREMDFQVTFVPEANFLYMPDHTTALQRAGIEVLYAPYVTNVEQHLRDSGNRYDLAFLFRPAVAERHMNSIRKFCPKAKVIFHTVDLHFLRLMREAELHMDENKKKAAEDMRQLELSLIMAADVSTVLSTQELTALTQYIPIEKVRLLPYSRNIEGTAKDFAGRRDIVFVGGYQHTPNVDAVQYFVNGIMPLLRNQLPGVRFYAVGSKVPAEIQVLGCEDVVITGFVKDLSPLLDKMRVSVAPLRYGAGIKGKIGTAMAAGLPVVATSLAAEGMSLTDGENILVADGTEAFANAVAKIYQDEALWDRISQNGLAFADNAWGAEAAWGILAAILADLDIDAKRHGRALSLYSEFKGAKAKPAKQPSLKPMASITSRRALEQLTQSESMKQIAAIETQLLNVANSEVFAVDGFCVPCDKKVSFLVDMQSGGLRHENGWTPNWRERLECPLCRMNNRQRLIATLVKQMLSAKQGQQVYFMEQVTPIFNWASTTFNQHRLVGSEFLGYEYESGATVKGIRHEDVENLSFSDDYFDLIVSNDVFEHVPNPVKAFSECARVLKPGGVMLATIPFHSASDLSVTRARINAGQLEHVLSPIYHGNPVSVDGSLVFTDFGWDLQGIIKEAGFSDVCVDVYASAEIGHLGGGQLIFRAWKGPMA